MDGVNDPARSPSPQPQQPRYPREGVVVLNSLLPLIRERKEPCVCLEPVGHRELISEPVVALDRLTLGCPACDRRSHTRLSDIVADTQGFPLRIARAKTCLD